MPGPKRRRAAPKRSTSSPVKVPQAVNKPKYRQAPPRQPVNKAKLLDATPRVGRGARPVINRKEMTSDSSRRIAQSKAQTSSLKSAGYRGNTKDRSERLYLKKRR